MSKTNLDDGSFYHGTKAQLKIGDYLIPGYNSNYGSQHKANFIYFSATLDAAKWGAELAIGDVEDERIYIVEPTTDFEDDPNLTDKKFPGNPTRSYRSKGAIKIIDEVSHWKRHSDDEINVMKEGIAEIKRKGIEAINE